MKRILYYIFGNSMKPFYRSLFIFSCFLLIIGYLVCFGVPKEEVFAYRMAKYPDQWQLSIDKTAKFSLMTTDDHEGKELLLKFLRNNQNPTYKGLRYIGIGLLMIAVFSYIGLLREKYLEKRQK